MPSAKVLAEKQSIVKELAEKMQNASAGVLVDYKGLNVEQDTKLRVLLRENDVEYSVVKNTLTRFAAKQVGLDELDPVLHGVTAMAISHKDPILPAKLLSDFAKKHAKVFSLKAGFMEGKVLELAQLEKLAELGSKDTLLATVLGTLNAPIAAFARVINAIAEQGGEAAPKTEAEAPAEEAPAAEAAPAEETPAEAAPAEQE